MKNSDNLLIIKEFDYKKFLLDKNEKDFFIVNIKDIRSNLKEILKKSFSKVYFGRQDLDEQLFVYFVKTLLVLVKSGNKYLIDDRGRKEKISFFKFVFVDTPVFILELIFNLLLVIFSWLGLIIFYFFPKKKKKSNKDFKNIIYLRTDNFRGLQQGGSFTHFRGVIKGFNELGYKINYIGSGKIEVSGLNFLQNIINYPKKFNLPEIPEIYYNWRFIPKAYKIIKAQKPLFIYQRHSIFNVCGVILSYLTKIPLILEFNGSEPWVRQKWGGLLIFKRLCYFMENICLKKANLISVVSQPIKDELLKQGIPEDEILVNYNGVNSEKFNPDIDASAIRKKLGIEDKIVIGTLSTFGVWHGTKVFSEAIKPTIQQYNNLAIHFLFIGDGVLRPECEKIIQESGMEKYVTFTGTIPFTEIPQYLSACDILVASHIPNPDGTPFFGSPTKLFEYMAIGKGIVASDLDQIGEVLEHKKTAWLVKAGDINDLVDGIIKLVQNKKLREILGKNARKEVVKNYTWEKNVKRILDGYEKLY